jgi:hypothetical protein
MAGLAREAHAMSGGHSPKRKGSGFERQVVALSLIRRFLSSPPAPGFVRQ